MQKEKKNKNKFTNKLVSIKCANWLVCNIFDDNFFRHVIRDTATHIVRGNVKKKKRIVHNSLCVPFIYSRWYKITREREKEAHHQVKHVVDYKQKWFMLCSTQSLSLFAEEHDVDPISGWKSWTTTFTSFSSLSRLGERETRYIHARYHRIAQMPKKYTIFRYSIGFCFQSIR